jgi:hypothetical protein
MRKGALIFICAALIVTAVPALAELETVTVGGSVRIRGNLIHNEYNLPPQLRHSPFSTLGRPIGGPTHPAIVSIFAWDDDSRDLAFVEQRTRLHVKADFTQAVSAFIEFDSYDVWGEDFRSADYLTGADSRAMTSDDVEVFQAYIEAKNLWDTNLSMRVGRQELSFGSEWLIGNRDFAFFYSGLSFDALRFTYAGESFTIDAWASKLAENMDDFGQGDIDFYGIYASCNALENHTFDLYALLLDDDTGAGGWDDSQLYTLGIRAAGRFAGSWDYDAEVAYQFGDADSVGMFVGDDNADWDNIGAKLEIGYAADMAWKPRFFVSMRYYGGEDDRDIGFWDWLNPFDKQDASVSFNRLFSDEITNGFLDLNNDMSNAWWVRLGVMAAPTEKLRGVLAVTYHEAVEAFDRPVVPIFTFWTDESSDDLGVEVVLFMEYQYSEDLVFDMGWAHLFTGEGLEDGNFSVMNGLGFNGGTDDDDSDYVYMGAKLFF